jgi:hypothetical protein
MRTHWARLRTTLPPDEIEEGYRTVQPGGLAVIIAVREAWSRLGMELQDIHNAGDHGWEQFAKRGKLEVWSQVTWFGDEMYLLGVGDCSFFLGQMPWRRFVDEVLVPFNEALRSDERFFEVNWIDPEKILQDGGAYSPADPSLPSR